MRKSVLVLGAAVVLAAVGGGGYFWAQHEGRRQLEAATAMVRASLGPDGSFTYENSQVHPFSRAADLDRVVLRQRGVLYTADHVRVTGGNSGQIASLIADNIREAPPDGRISTVARLEGSDLVLPPATPGAASPLNFAAIQFRRAELTELRSQIPGGEAAVNRATVNDYGAGRRSSAVLEGVVVPITDSEDVDRVTAAKVSLAGVDLAAVVDAARRGAQPDLSAPGQASYAAEGVAVTQKEAKVFEFAKGEVLTDVTEASGSFSGRLNLGGFSFAKGSGGGGNILVAALPEMIRGDASLPVSFAAAGGRLDLGSWTLRVDQVGTLNLAARFANVDAAAIKAGAGKPDPFVLLGTQVVSASLGFEDGGYRQALLDVLKRQTGQSDAALTQNIADLLANNPMLALIPGAGGPNGAATAFWRQGGGLQVQVSPATPMGVMEIAMGVGNPDVLVRRLAARMTSTPPGTKPPGTTPRP